MSIRERGISCILVALDAAMLLVYLWL